jgi:FkbM family methyltransferase
MKMESQVGISIMRTIFLLIPNPIKIYARKSQHKYIFGLYLNTRCKIESPEFYGQFSEDQIIESYLPEITGTYVDIGAGYPVRGSNTYLFYRKGWRGICVEPININCKLFRWFRGGDKIINSLCGLSEQSVEFFEFEAYEYSTTSRKVAEAVLAEGRSKLLRKISIPCSPMKNFAPEMRPSDATFISVDAEGAELEILMSNDWIRTRPRLLCVEEWSDSISDGQSKVSRFLNETGYTKVAQISLSVFYLENSISESVLAHSTRLQI